MGRIGAILLRHFYLWRSSWTRLFDLVYWPLLQVIVWGFITTFLTGKSSWVAQAGGVFIGAVLLWDVLVRSQFGMTLTQLEEMWSRNLANLFVSPLRPVEYGAAMMALAILRTAFGVVPAAFFAMLFFDYSIFALGLPLIAFWTLLIAFGWGVGLVLCGLLLRYGLAAESYAWASIFVLSPICGVFYPIATLPPWLRAVSWSLAPSYVFEGLRALILDNVLRWDLMLAAFLLDILAIAIGFAVFLFCFHRARERGSLMSAGE
jgi:ABC-2 type transport system permease protein